MEPTAMSWTTRTTAQADHQVAAAHKPKQRQPWILCTEVLFPLRQLELDNFSHEDHANRQHKSTSNE